uniref:Uncharacterized protein n=1 Tax=Arundo donax TaxID=35708 RepID=A0A0A8YJ73_ARUDO
MGNSSSITVPVSAYSPPAQSTHGFILILFC